MIRDFLKFIVQLALIIGYEKKYSQFINKGEKMAENKQYKNLTLHSVTEKLETVSKVCKKEISSLCSRELRGEEIPISQEDVVFIRYWSHIQGLYEELNRRKQLYSKK